MPEELRRAAPVRYCEKRAIKGTGEGVCDHPLDDDGYCPNWNNHKKEDE